MSSHPCAAIILAAGKGTRMKSALPKVLHPIAGRPMLAHVLDAVTVLEPVLQVVVVAPDMEQVATAVASVPTAVQPKALGTADAVKAAREALGSFADGSVFILNGDTPFIRAETLAAMRARRATGAGIVVLGMRPRDPSGYGRLVLNDSGQVTAIVEDRDADDEVRRIDLCNSGVMAVDASALFSLLDAIGNDNAKGEYYLTDIVAIGRDRGLSCVVVEAPEEELLGVDSRADLANAEALWQAQRRSVMMDAGVSLTAPETVWFSYDTRVGADVTIGQNVVIAPGVTIEDGAEIRPFSHLEGAHVGKDSVIGPYARLRPGTSIGANARVGNFVEIKNTELGDGAKANHLTYLGDSTIGGATNIGAGTITCNYDGYLKHRTEIGQGVFIGSNVALVAPVRVGDGAVVGAGSVVSSDVGSDAVALARGEQVERAGAAVRYREKRAALKAGGKTGGKG